MRVIFLHGPAAAGKHTIGSLLSKRTGLPLFHNHLAVDLAKALFDFGTPGFARLRASVWRAAFSEAARANRSFVFTFHPEATVDPGLISELVELVSVVGGRVDFVELICPRETVLERLGNPSRLAFGKLTDPGLYVRFEAAGGFQFPPLPDPLLRIDTSQVDVDGAAQLIEEAMAASDP
ncbi:MAG: shikimate kinase [Planctomycetaceae bacterium]|nr:shikimate kinase [Planctomycetaceae bacterium]